MDTQGSVNMPTEGKHSLILGLLLLFNLNTAQKWNKLSLDQEIEFDAIAKIVQKLFCMEVQAA